MNEAEQKRFKYLCDDSDLVKAGELQDLIKFTKNLHGENKNLQEKVENLKEERKGVYRRWCDGWNLDGGELWAMVLAHVVLVIAFIFAMIGAFALVKNIQYKEPTLQQAILTNRYYLSQSHDTNVGNCIQVFQEILHGTDIRVSQCFKEDKDALEWAKHLVEVTGGTFKREEAKETQGLVGRERMEQDLGRGDEEIKGTEE